MKSPVTKPDAKKKKLSELMDESGSEEEEELVAPSGGRSHVSVYRLKTSIYFIILHHVASQAAKNSKR